MDTLLAQIESAIPNFTEYGILGILGVVIGVLVFYHFPQVVKSCEKNHERLCTEMKTGFESIREANDRTTQAVKENGDRMHGMLTSTMAKLLDTK